MKTKIITLTIALLAVGIMAVVNVSAQSNTETEAYIQKLLAHVGTKTVEGKTLVYYRTGYGDVTLVVCRISASKSTQCDVTIYTGFSDKSMYEFYKNSKNAFSDDQRKQMTFVDEAQCYFTKSENESFAQRQNLSKGNGAVIVR